MSHLTIRELIGNLRAKKTSLESIVRTRSDLIARDNTALNALAHHNRDSCILKAREYDQQRGNGRPPLLLEGATFSTRLSIDVAGMPYSDGSLAKAPEISTTSNETIARLERRGALCLGKGNIAERGKSYYSENPRYGRTNHYLDSTLSPGGSGGGDAVAVASGMVDFAIGADAGGSVRVPAQFCGLFGLAATPGLLSEAGASHYPGGILRHFKTLGVLTRTLDDLEIIFSHCEGFDARDPYSSESLHSTANPSMRFLVVDELNKIRPANEISSAIADAIKKFESIGYCRHEVKTRLFDNLIEPYVTLAAQAQLTLEDAIAQQNGSGPDLAGEGPHIKALRARVSKELPPLTSEKVLLSWHQIDQARLEVATLFSKIDFIIAPVSATLAVAHNTSPYLVNGNATPTELVFQFASLSNSLALPAIATPSQPTSSGLPVGFQIIGPRYSERKLFSLLRLAGY